MTSRALFGGAIMCLIPSDWRDVSDVRQVPDHQECWQSTTTGQVLVVEILEQQTDVMDEHAVEYFFRDLAEANGIPMDGTQQEKISLTPVVHSPSIGTDLPPDARVYAGVGRQLVAQGRDTDISGNPRQLEAHWVRIDLCVIRLPSVATQLLITLNSPGGTPPAIADVLDITFLKILQSLQIVDWSLFG